LKLQAIDDSNRGAHYFLTPDDRCFFLHEFTARKGYNYSPGNQFIFNFKKSPAQKHEPHFAYKLRAIQEAISIYRSIFAQVSGLYNDCTFTPIPPSKVKGHAEYDDRMWQVVEGVCRGNNADARELIIQTRSYDSAHNISPSVELRLLLDHFPLRRAFRTDPPRTSYVDDHKCFFPLRAGQYRSQLVAQSLTQFNNLTHLVARAPHPLCPV
jgi:hypothetical protein